MKENKFIMDKLPNDILNYIMGKVDKYEHLSTLLDSFTIEELPRLREIIKNAIDKKNLLNGDIFGNLKEEQRKLHISNKQNGTNQFLYIDIDVKSEIRSMKITKFGRKYLYCEEKRSDDKTINWKICTYENIKRIYTNYE